MKTTLHDPPTAPALLSRPRNPARYATLRIQRRTARSFETTNPPDVLAAWLLDQGFKPAGARSSPHEYGRLGRGQWQSKPAELVILYWSGSVLCQGADADRAAALLATICEAAPEQATMFDGLEGGAE